MNIALHTRIAEHTQRLERLESERARIIRELQNDLRQILPASGGLSTAKEPEEVKQDDPAKRLSKSWRLILAHFASRNGFTATEIERAVYELRNKEADERKKIKIQKAGNIRTQLCIYEKKEIIRRIGNGRYRVTTRTKTVLGQQQS